MASAGSNVILSLDSISGTTATIIYSITTSGRHEDGYLVVLDENDTEVSRTSQFRAYGSSSGSTTVTKIASGHLYTVKFYSSELGVYSTSAVEIDLRTGDPSYSLSSSSTGTSVNILLSPLASTMGQDGDMLVTLTAVDGDIPTEPMIENVRYKATDIEASTRIVGLTSSTEYTFTVSYYDPGLSSDVTSTVIISTAEIKVKTGPRLYGGVNGGAELIERMYGSEGRILKKIYGPGDDYVFTDLQLKGDTFQQTYSGKNLFNYTDTTNVGQNITVASTGYITCTVNNSSGSSTIYRNYFTNPLNLQPSTQYALVFEILSSSGEWKIEGGGEDQSASQVSGYGVRSGEVTAGDTIVQIVTSKTDVSGSAGIRPYFRFLAGQSGSVTVRISVLADTSVTPETFVYEPYVGGIPAPNPDYPQEIQTVTGEQTVSISDGDESQSYKVNLGKNLFNTSRLSNSSIATGPNSIKLEKPDTRTVNAYFPSRLPAGTYTLSYDVVKGGGNTDGVRCAIYIVNAAGTGTEQLAAVRPYDGHVSYTFTAPRAVDRLYLYINMPQPDGATVEINNIQVEKGPSETDFAAYVEPIELCKIGDYQDYIYKSGDDWYVHKACGKVILDGSENYFKSGTTACDVYGTNITTGASPTTTEVISNHFVYSISNSVGKTRKYQDILYFGFASYGTTDITTFKTWLSTHNTIVYYILATPTDTQITDTTLIEQLEALRKGALSNAPSINIIGNLPAILDYDTIVKESILIHVDRKKN